MKQNYFFQHFSLLVLGMAIVFSEAAAQTFVPLGAPAPAKQKGENHFSKGSGNYAPGTILVGDVPPNSGSKPVLVFVHGYTGNADTWFVDNDMYEKAYYDGYRTAFAVVHPDKSMWTNGQLFASQLQSICSHFGVSKVVVIAHSKGGVDTDAALVHYSGFSRVNRVITLGTPHFGTPLADLAQSGWVWWLSAIFGQRNEATYVLQTGYMSYYRSISDSRPENAATDFRTYGGWRYYGSLWTSGVYLSANGGSAFNGGNDGVVNYRSSRRPYGRELFSGYGDSRTAYNHYDLAKGTNVWNYVKGQLPSALYREAATEEAVAASYNPVAVVRSNYQLLSGESGTASFQLEEGAGPLQLEVRQARQDDALSISTRGKDLLQLNSRQKQYQPDGMLGNYATHYELQAPAGGEINLTSSGPFVAILSAEEGGWAELTTDLGEHKPVYTAGERMQLRMYLQDAGGRPVTGASVTGSLRLTANLQGAATTAESGQLALSFQEEKEAGYYSLTTPALWAGGIYNLSLQASSPRLTRSLVHSVAVLDPDKALSGEGIFTLQAWPNPTRQLLNLRYELQQEQALSFRILDLQGRVVHQQQLNQPAGIHSLQWTNSELVRPGTYVYQLSGAEGSQSGKFVILP